MKVNVRVLGYLGKYCATFGGEERAVVFPGQASAGELLALLGIPEKENLVLLVNGQVHKDKGIALSDGDTVWIYPFVGGG